MRPNDVLVHRNNKRSAGASTESLTLRPVDTGEVWRYDSVGYTDETTACTGALVYVLSGNVKHYIGDAYPLAAGRLAYLGRPVYLAAGQSLGVDFLGTTSADMLTVYGCGIVCGRDGD